jgi:hypothetical protein
MDTLTKEQREAIAAIIEDAPRDGDYHFNGEDSVWEENAASTLSSLAYWFRNYDSASVLD